MVIKRIGSTWRSFKSQDRGMLTGKCILRDGENLAARIRQRHRYRPAGLSGPSHISKYQVSGLAAGKQQCPAIIRAAEHSDEPVAPRCGLHPPAMAGDLPG